MSAGSLEQLERLQPLLATRSTPVFLVGGAVRDALLGRPAYDLDFVVERDAISLAFAVADALRTAAYALDRERDIGRVVLGPDAVLDFARFRGPTLEADLRARDFTVNAMAIDVAALQGIQPLRADTDAGDGDLLSVLPPGAIVDPCDGLADMQARLLRQTHAGAIAHDPIRALRAVRLSWQLGMELESQTAGAARAAAPALHTISAERVRDEFLKLLRGPAPHRALQQMSELALLEVVLPEIAALRDVQQSAPHHEPVLAHTFSVLQRLLQVEAALSATDEPPDSAIDADLFNLLQPHAAPLRAHLQRPLDGMLDGVTVLRLGALFHDVGKRVTATVEKGGRIRFLGHDKEGAAIASRRLGALRLSNEGRMHVRDIVAAHMRPLHLTNAFADGRPLSRRSAYRYFRATGHTGLDVALLSLADHLATYDGRGPLAQWRQLLSLVSQLLDHYFEKYRETVAPPPLLKGSELITALNLHPGPQIGHLLRLIEEAQAAGDIKTKEEALELARVELEAKRLGD